MRALALLPLLLAGCFGFGHCGYMPSEASWSDPVLYDAVDAPVIPAQGIEVDVPGVALGSIVVRSEEHKARHGPSVHYADGALMGSIEQGQPTGALQTAARILLENATRLEDAAIAQEVDAFIASGEASPDRAYHFEDGETVEVTFMRFHHPVAIDADLLLANMGFNGTTADGLEHGPIGASFRPDKKEVDLGGYYLVVNIWGHASMQHAWPEETPDEDILADVQRVMQEAGLPVPESVETSGAIC